MSSKKTQAKNVRNPLEAVGNFGRDVSDSLLNDLAIKGGKDFIDFLGLGSSTESNQESSSNSTEVDIVNFRTKEEPKREAANKPEATAEAAIDYHRDVLRSSEQI